MSPDEIYCELLYQIGAVKTFCDEAGVPFNHVKCHGKLYIDIMGHEEKCEAAMRAIQHFKVPVCGMKGTWTETIPKRFGMDLILEAFVDVNYLFPTELLIPSLSRRMSVEEIAENVRSVCEKDKLDSINEGTFDTKLAGAPFSICLHSDLPDCEANVAAARKVIDAYNAKTWLKE